VDNDTQTGTLSPRVARRSTSTTEARSSLEEVRVKHLYLTRGLIAIAWAIAFMAVADSRTEVKVGAGVLLVLYPLIDVIASLIDARHSHGTDRQLLFANATLSAIAAVALGVAATGSIANVLAVFGVWAVVAGAAQLGVASRRRARLGTQWPTLLAGAGSVVL